MAVSFFRSLKEKLLAGYLIGFFLMLGITLINLNNFTKMQSIVLESEAVSELIDTILEVRRYEKNYFLYGQEEDLKELKGYLLKLEEILKKNKSDIVTFVNYEFVISLKKNITEYEKLLNQLQENNNPYNPYLEEKIRNIGREIAQNAEKLAEIKKEKLKNLISSTKKILIISIFFITLFGFIVGAIFYRMFVMTLMIFEKHMNKIAEGEYYYIPTISTDREMVSLSKAFNRMLEELELRQTHLIQKEKLASIGTLLFGIVHELNNPLNNISTSCQILKEELESEDIEFKRELLSQIESETDRARDIVRSILDYSKTGKKETVNLNVALKEAIRLIKAEIPPKIEIIMDIPEDITLYADPQQIKQVFLNLIKNSIEAIEGSGQIRIIARMSEEEEVEIKVSDTGKGIPPQVLSRIFDPFFTTKDSKKGYGLGLFVTHHIIKEHGGTINVTSSQGEGTTFIIKLPAKEKRDYAG